MKRELNPMTVGVIITVVAVAVLAGGFLYYFKDSIGPKPVVKPKPWRPPGAWSGAPGSQGQAGPGAPAKPANR